MCSFFLLFLMCLFYENLATWSRCNTNLYGWRDNNQIIISMHTVGLDFLRFSFICYYIIAFLLLSCIYMHIYMPQLSTSILNKSQFEREYGKSRLHINWERRSNSAWNLLLPVHNLSYKTELDLFMHLILLIIMCWCGKCFLAQIHIIFPEKIYISYKA